MDDMAFSTGEAVTARRAAAGETVAIARINSADTAALVERLDVGSLIEDGRVTVIGLDAIRDKLGERWVRKQTDVWAYTERSMGKFLSPQDLFHRLNDTEYLIAVASDNAMGGQTICMHVLEDVLVYFLGGCKQSDLVLKTVTKIDGQTLECDTVNVAAISRPSGPVEARNADGASPGAPRRAMPAMVVLSMVSVSGRELSITHTPEQISSLRHNVVAGVRAEPIVIDVASGRRLPRLAFLRLADADLQKIDQATLEMGLQVAKMIESDRPGIILPLSFQTLASQRARTALFAGVTAETMRQRFLIEVTNIEPGTPNGRLIETAALLKAYTTGVLARILPSKAPPTALTDARLAAVALDLTDSGDDEAVLLGIMRGFHARSIGLAPSLQLLGLPSRGLFDAALSLGFTHASVRRQAAVNLAA
jgi:hypothetical protein